MPNDDRAPLLARLLTSVLRRGLRPPEAQSFDRLAPSVTREVPGRSVPLALVRLRRHLRRGGRSALSERPRAPRRPGGAERAR